MARTYDLIVVGSGPAGEKGAAQAAYFGKSVALVEEAEDLGGAAANTGTLPSKTLRESALHLTGFRHRDLSGLNVQLRHEVGASDFLRRARMVAETERSRIALNLDRHDVTLIRGRAHFVAADTLEVRDAEGNTSRLTGKTILIATGSSPYRPPYLPFDDPRVFDSDTILNIAQMPRSIVIVGGGVIGSEYACMFAALDVDVKLIEGRDRLLGFMDHEISAILAHSMTELGVELVMEDTIEGVEDGERLGIRLASGREIETDAILAATGRSGNSDGLGLEEAGIETGPRGTIKVDGNYRTSAPNIYAVGDVIGFPALASTSMEQARVAMVHAFDLKYKTSLAHILPYGIYTIPECSMAGETEQSLQEKGVPYVAGVAQFSENARGQIVGDRNGFLKLLFDSAEMKLLGVHVIGEQASELVHVGLTALLMEATADLFIQTCYNYPTLSEVYKYATYDALGARSSQPL
jgi:NAD(P) transhydrogenase